MHKINKFLLVLFGLFTLILNTFKNKNQPFSNEILLLLHPSRRRANHVLLPQRKRTPPRPLHAARMGSAPTPPRTPVNTPVGRAPRRPHIRTSPAAPAAPHLRPPPVCGAHPLPRNVGGLLPICPGPRYSPPLQSAASLRRLPSANRPLWGVCVGKQRTRFGGADLFYGVVIVRQKIPALAGSDNSFNLSAGDFCTRIARGLCGEIIRLRVNHNRPADNLANLKSIRQKHRKGRAAILKQWRHIPACCGCGQSSGL